MCGIAGIWSTKTNIRCSEFSRALNTLEHRGPDHEGTWQHPRLNLLLGNRRLAIQDLSENGNQPIYSPCKRYTLVLNGEIYNYLELQKTLRNKYAFKGSSDSEVFGVALSEWGIYKTLDMCNGMFAIAIWDEFCQSLFLIRDRIGIKPLFLGNFGHTIAFSSELKALREFSQISLQINYDSLATYFRYGYIPAPYSIYENVYKVEAGEIIQVCLDEKFNLQKKHYWSLQKTWQKGIADPYCDSESQLLANLEDKLLQSVKLRTISDVPVGAFLSGGVDSSLVVSMLKKIASDVQTFSIGIDEGDYNEAPYAKKIAQHLGTEHNELVITPQDMFTVLQDIPKIWDEPFSDSSQIPTYIVSRLAKQKVTVALSGDGGDELFSGYKRYRKGHIISKAFLVPHMFRKLLLGSLAKNRKYKIFANKHFIDSYIDLVSHTIFPHRFVNNGSEQASILHSNVDGDYFQKMSFWDLDMYLPDDILTKVDRASMSVSLEARVPLLDHNVIAFAAHIPTYYKRKNGQTKYLLQKLLEKYVPKEYFCRPKKGFGIPKLRWIKEYYSPWLYDLLNEQKIKRQSILNCETVRQEVLAFKQGNLRESIWDLIIAQLWLDYYS